MRCTKEYLYILTYSGNIYILDNNKLLQLPIDKIIKIESSEHTICFLSSSGNVWYKFIGNKNIQKLPFDSFITDISVGFYFDLLVSNNILYFVVRSLHYIYNVKIIKGIKPSILYIGHLNYIILDTNGKYWVWNKNNSINDINVEFISHDGPQQINKILYMSKY